MSDEIIKNLGPLAPLAGTWRGDQGIDTSRIHSKETVTKYREEALFSPIGPVNNGPQKLYGLRYSMTAWPLDSRSEERRVGKEGRSRWWPEH